MSRFRFEALEPRMLLSVSVVTNRNDVARTGANLQETVLTPSNVNSSQFGKLFTQNVDGQVYAQPLVVAGVRVGGSVHDLVIVATENDSVYAFDADSDAGANAAPLWHTSFLRRGVTPEPGYSDDIEPEIGITGTPVIDPTTDTLYVVATTRSGRHGDHTYTQEIHALSLSTGKQTIAPTLIDPVLPGTGDGSDGQNITFDAFSQNQRSALLLLDGVIYVTWASHGDIPPYHGWIVGYDETTLAQVRVFNDTPNGSDGGIWMSGAGISADANGFLYVGVGNGTFDANTGGLDYGSSILKLSTRKTLHVVDSFTPFNEAALSNSDNDLGTGATLILPDQKGAHTHLLISPSKSGVIYVADRDDLGGFNPAADDDVQDFGAFAAYSSPAYYNGVLYQVTNRLYAYPVSGNGLGAVTSTSRQKFGYPGASPSISANGAKNGILWLLTPAGTDKHTVLEAFNSANLALPLYTSDQAGTRDQGGVYTKFTVPTIANGHVYVGTASGLEVFGILNTANVQPVTRPTAAAIA